MSVQIFFILQNHPTFHSVERLVNLVRGRECFTVWKIISSDWRCQNVLSSITQLFVIKQGLFSFVIYHKRFCYYSVIWQNVQWLIQGKHGCWVEDRAVKFCSRRRTVRIPPCLIFKKNIFFFISTLKDGHWSLVNKKSYE